MAIQQGSVTTPLSCLQNMTENVRTLHCVGYDQNYVIAQGTTIVQVIIANNQANYEMDMLGKNHNYEVATALAKYLPREQMLYLVKSSYCDLIFIISKTTALKKMFQIKIPLTFLINFSEALKNKKAK